MSEPVDTSGIGRMLTQTMSALKDFQNAQADGEEIEGAAQSDDGMISVRVGPPGRITELLLDTRVTRYGSEVLATEITEIVNRAMADLQDKAVPGAGAGDFGALGEKLREIQEDSQTRLNSFTNALVEAQERIVRQASR